MAPVNTDLDSLHLLVDNSELWIYKSKNGVEIVSWLNDNNGISNGDLNVIKSNEDDADGDMKEYGGRVNDNISIDPHTKPAPMLSSSEK